MREPLPLEVTALATHHIHKAEEWWRENRVAAPNALHEQLQRAFSLITVQPKIGSRATAVRLAGIRRIFLPAIKYYLYYRLVGGPERIQVVALWHSRRGKGPPI